MPMDFPDMKSLTNRAEMRGFRQPHEGEEEPQYRAAFAEFMRDVDRVESVEIAQGRGWDRIDPFTMLSGALGGSDKVHELLNELRGDVQPAKTIPPFPHLMITSPRDPELMIMYFGSEAETMIKSLEEMMATSPVVRSIEELADSINNTDSLSAAASRYVVSKMLALGQSSASSVPLQLLANQLGSRMLVGDLPLNITVSTKKDHANDDGFALSV